MHKVFLGDAKDFAKGRILDLLRGKGPMGGDDLIGRLCIFPMPAGQACADDNEFHNHYKLLLGGDALMFSEDQIWGGTAAQRDSYLDSVNRDLVSNSKHSVFLDPDTGVLQSEDSDAGRARMKKRDLICLVNQDRDRVVIVFDDSYSYNATGQDSDQEVALEERELDRLESIRREMHAKLNAVRELATSETDVDGFGYIGMSVNFLFFANHAALGRLDGMKTRLEKFVGQAASRRIVNC